jgi:transcriptional regulator with XRE-family HTH domain
MPQRGHRRPTTAPPTALAAVLDEQGRRLSWLADRLQVDSSTVSRWRSGERAIPIGRIPQLARVLDVASEDLVGPEANRLSEDGGAA